MRGRRPKPTLLKLMLGNPGQQRMNMNEPLPAANIVIRDPPDWLTPNQRIMWTVYAHNAPAGLLKKLDQMTFAVWIVAADTYKRAAQALAAEQENGKDMVGTRARRLQTVVNTQAEILRRYSTELGFSPAARPRIQVTPEPGADKSKSEFEQLLG